jgi:hypothetical protein
MSRRLLATLALMVLPSFAAAQAVLPVGSTGSGTLGEGGAAVRYRFTAAGPGVLTVALHGASDLTLEVLDEDGQPVPDGRADRDLNGELGAEMVSVVLAHGGAYLVEVASNGEESATRFTIGGSWVSMPAFERPPDPDRRPGQARALTVGAAHTDAVNPGQGDLWDWFSVRVSEAMTLVIVTRMEEGTEGDLVLEAYLGGSFGEPTTQSDQDLQGHTGNESVTIDVKAGETVHIKVKSLATTGESMPYRLSVGRVP